ncbi:RecQ family ATP-dependent DNA helicase [Roseivirga spongicola]|uniref:DNA 3'-5' helicase n=1 Tax=Roseivirga spongicola TaxID=333140 RepID=A0A150XGC2_9BACT|nr:RecQ family ATP-dependent DNA helicase [Roseivirga spongicola]KYG77753.1 ATP-binding protein [Roseivirga spongicola]WPZ11480.1 RecQ family ATP-dependent DNA helicase [Roseivirga spongicola]
MKNIVFIDTEVDPKNNRILDIGAIKSNGDSFHSNSIPDFIRFLTDSEFICGHNILSHDLKFIRNSFSQDFLESKKVIDTLHLSPLLFPSKPYHNLLKDDKLLTEEINNPLNDSIKAKDLFFDELTAFQKTEGHFKEILYLLLHDKKEFSSFFNFVDYRSEYKNPTELIHGFFQSKICTSSNLLKISSEHPVELAYALALINSKNKYSITPPWVLRNYREVERIVFLLRNKPCIKGCVYCDQALDIHAGLKRFFGFNSYRSYGGEPLQEKAVKAAIDNKSILTVFPTGGGKSITFQVPALMSGENTRGLTVVISPLQSLMKDQVDNLERVGITESVTINGLLDPIERSKSFERVEDGSASILYISPESLRSKSIERLILGRKISRFVIDEAHCFSSWGQDFRVDYLYIGDFIKSIQEKKNLEEGIPVSCFTATAKRKVIEDIREYFKNKLGLSLELFSSKESRKNLHYQVFEKENEEEKYNTARDLVDEKNCPTIIYVSRTRRAYELAERLVKDGYKARPYHGRMEKQEKSANQDAFINGEVQIMVATSAFGMGVDKKDVGMVIHYEISDSLENYVQEAGRAGRDQSITADCYVLFNEEDLSKHFILLNQTKLSIKEIQQIWKAIKHITRFRSTASNSALEIARKAGWDDNIRDIETRVTTAIAALEDAGYLKRGQNMPRIFANSILAKNAQEAIDRINASEKFQENQKEKGVRIIKSLFSSKSRKQSNDDVAESRVDYISDHLGIVKEEVINIVKLLREEKILADAKDLTAFIQKDESVNRSLHIVQVYAKIEKFLLSVFQEEERTFHIKELNETAEENGCNEVSPQKLKTIINFWAIKNWIKRHLDPSKNHITVLCSQSKLALQDKLEKRHELAQFIIELLHQKSSSLKPSNEKEQVLVEFSVQELKKAYENRQALFRLNISTDDIEDTLFYLSRIEAIKIEGGFLVVYNKLTVERIEQDNKKRYKIEDYQKLNQFYESKVQQIHIVGEYAKKMISDYKDALQFVEDYFQLNDQSFLSKYFKGSRQDEIKRNITPSKFRQLFGELSPTQLKIINDRESKQIVVAAGPGSGKTRVLVHKLASLLLMEDVKHEQLLMLTFSRAAATEFKKRLLQLIGNAALYVDIKTFHSYCFDLLGKVGTLDKSDGILKRTVERIRVGEVESNRIARTVLVIDEAQDMNSDEFELIQVLMEQNEEMRVIAVGDDDQNIYEFRGSSSKYLEQFIRTNKAVKYELVENYRSKSNLVEFTNQFVRTIHHRLKNTPIIARQAGLGVIKIIQYQSTNLITPLVQSILESELMGTTCVLTKTNEEAMFVTGLLLNNKRNAKLIQTNDGFSLYNLVEVRFFIGQLNLDESSYIVHEENWEEAKRELRNQFESSTTLEICQNIIRDFEVTNPKKKYRSDFEVFIRESKLEDFYGEDVETIFVSTIHKAKGKEFDSIFLLLDNFNLNTDEAKRQVYVALTRAKQNLSIHLNSRVFEHINSQNIIKTIDPSVYSPPDEILLQLTHRDVQLGYFEFVQHRIRELLSGDALLLSEEGCLNTNREFVLKFSKSFKKKLKELEEKGFKTKDCKINYLLFWKAEDSDREVGIVLPEIYFERNDRTSLPNHE